MNNIAIVVILIVIAVLALFLIPQFLVKRAIAKVIKIFRQLGAIDIRSARTIDELGLRPESMFNRMMKPRDYKPRALQALISADIIRTTEDGKLYLSEENLAASKLRGY